jgi:hypothetical protein
VSFGGFGGLGAFGGLTGAELCTDSALFPDLTLLEPLFVVESPEEDFFDEPASDFEPVLDFVFAFPLDPE